MLRRSDLVDLYSMADPAKCKEYIILTTKAISNLFTEVNLTPKERGGSLYVQSIEGIKRMTGDERAVHDANCTKIAFFFIRIFQTFGALTLSVMDDSIPQAELVAPVSEKRPERYQKAFARPLPFAPPPTKGFLSGTLGGSLSGGALKQRENPTFFIPPATPYSVLNNYLSVPRDGSTTARMPFTGSSALQMVQTGLYRFADDGARSIADPISPIVTYSMRSAEGNVNASANLHMEVDGSRYTLSIDKIKVGDDAINEQISRVLTDDYNEGRPSLKGAEIPAVISDMFKEAIVKKLGFSAIQLLEDKRYITTVDGPATITGTRIQIPTPRASYRANPIPIVYNDSIRVDNKTAAIKVSAGLSIDKIDSKTYAVGLNFDRVKVSPDYAREMVDFTGFGAQKRFTVASDSAEPVNDKGEKIPEYLQRRFDAILKPAKSGKARPGARYTREGLPKPYVSSGVPDGLRVDGLWAALVKTPPVKAHCTARALQLLNVASLRGDMTSQAFSNVCNTKFQLVVDKSLPGLGQPIVEEYSIAALASLFVDGLQNNMPLVTNGAKYHEFLTQLNMAFYGYRTIDETPQPDNMAGITDQPLSSLCVGQGPIQVDASRSKLRSIATRLLSRQKQHYSSVMNLIFRLFDQSKVKAGLFQINPLIMAGGMEAVNRVAVDARELLIKYYGDCESTYKEGVLVVQEQERGKTPVIRAEPDATAPPEEENAPENNDPDV